ncbi:MAG: signal recognition particle protein [Planctomycetes bacterium]|jgi:signal recognition particle subunit SRP54|nr:signal recognition particle protein [Planctomycetota bacterium]MDP7246362.1 signal recognition particle protein [Planctomycetota bacterium]|tara:strand:- start:1110 stop:2504 length:1395 start_codon:yes stop_codon:yes gene_type:complete
MLENLTQSFGRVLDRFRGPRKLTSEEIQEALRDVRRALLEADVHFRVAKEFTKRVAEQLENQSKLGGGVQGSQQAVHAFHQELANLMRSDEPALPSNPGHPMVLLLAGLQGAGKTTTAAKLALWLRKRKNSKVLLAACDLQRPAAVDQLVTLGRQLDIPVYSETPGPDVTPEGVAQRALEQARTQRFDAVILDSAGRLHIDEELMEEIQAVSAGSQPDATYLVLDSMTGQDAVESAQRFNESLTLHGLILTKMDGDARGGAALSVREISGKPISFLGIGEKPGDLEEFDADRLAGRILDMGDIVGLVEGAQEALQEEQKAQDYTKMMEGKLTMADLLDQFRMFKKMGSMKKVLGMMPGMGRMSGLLDSMDDGQFARIEAIVLSMTPKERLHPELLDGSRRKRIARGCGQDVSAVNQLLRSFQDMQKQMKSMGKMMKSGRSKKRLLQQFGRPGSMPNFPGAPKGR